MVRPDGLVKVLDFGLAKLTERTTATSEVDSQGETMARLSTEPGVVMGTPAYMSPEQARGQELDARADLFSFGVMLYEMATGCAPFKGETPAAVFAELLKHLPPPVRELNPDLPVELEQIVGKALEKDREARYQSAKDLLADLKRLSRDVSSKQAVASAGVANRRKAHSGAKPRRMRAALVVALSVAAAGALLLSGLAVWRSLIPRRRAEPPSVRRLTFNPAMDIFPVFSPDDRQIAFISNRDGKTALFVMSADGGGARRITDVSYGSSFPQWSPDGKRIAFEMSSNMAVIDHAIYLMEPDGSGIVKLPWFNKRNSGQWFSWSRDGKRLVTTSEQTGDDEIYIVSAEFSADTWLTRHVADDVQPDWSPDGSKLLYASQRDGNAEIYVMDLTLIPLKFMASE